MGNISYRESHAFILNHKYHQTITDIGIFRNLYHNFAYILIPITNLCLFKSFVCRTELLLIFITTYTYLGLTLIADLFLFGSYTHSVQILYLYYGTHIGLTELILVLRNLYWYFRSYTCITILILELHILFMCEGARRYDKSEQIRLMQIHIRYGH